jgi:hypothetical protein
MEKLPPLSVFCSYSQEDMKRLLKTVKGLASLQPGWIDPVWYDRKMLVGTAWEFQGFLCKALSRFSDRRGVAPALSSRSVALWIHLSRLQLIRWKTQQDIRLDSLRVRQSQAEFFNNPTFRVTPATPTPTPRSIRNRHLYRRALTALLAVDILGRNRIVVGAAIRYGRVTVERRGSQADVDFLPRGSIRAAINVIARDILRRRCLPVQVYDMVGSGLNCERVGLRRSASTTALDLDRE